MTSLPPAPIGIGAIAIAAALLIGVYLIVSPGPTRIPRERRRPTDAADVSALTRTANLATNAIERVLRSRGAPGADALQQAGVKMRLQDFAFLVIVAILVAGAAGMLLGGLVLGLVLAVLVPLGVRIALQVMAGRRRAAFAEQLDDSLQLMASSLRAGHSMLQALASVAREAEQPTSEEFTRVINETRIGRELGEALEETAERMESQDFVWVTQAIAINREVGGNLAEVLDGVGHTIRERNQIRRQVSALSSEGKMSAYVLMALPVGIVGFLSVTSPSYMMAFTSGLLGYILIGVSVVMLVVGALWLRKVVSIKF
jgi:tight adherence protein B